MKCPQYIKINDKKYKINTDFRVAIECNRIAQDETIGDYERALAIIYKLYGEEALNDYENHEQILKLTQKYLTCGKELEHNDEPDMDFIEDMDYIEASFMSDYNIDITNTDMDWYKFNNLMNGLSNSELGNCCVLNRIRNLRTYDTREIKDRKERERIEEAKRKVALKKKNIKITKEQEQSMNELNEILGL